MKWISTTIKKEYMILILAGVKTSEYKGKSKFWNKRIMNLKDSLKYKSLIHSGCIEMYCAEDIGINFLCGRKSYKFRVIGILDHHHPMKIDNKQFSEFWEIQLGKRLDGDSKC